MKARDTGSPGSYCGNGGSAIVTNVPLVGGHIDGGEAVCMWVQGVYGKSLYISLTFAIDLKLL